MQRAGGIAVALALLASPAAAAETAEAFVSRIYDEFTSVNGPYLGIEEVYSQRVVKLIEADNDAARGEVGYLDFNPLCQCQDAKNFMASYDVKVTGSTALAAVKYSNMMKPSQLTLKLVKEKGEWRVDDVVSRGKSMQQGLRRSTAAMLKEKRA